MAESAREVADRAMMSTVKIAVPGFNPDAPDWRLVLNAINDELAEPIQRPTDGESMLAARAAFRRAKELGSLRDGLSELIGDANG